MVQGAVGRALGWAGVALGALLSGCDDEEFNGRETVIPADQAEVLRIFDTECVSCHAGLDAAGGLDLSSDLCGRLFDGLLVVPEAPFASAVYLRLVSPSAPMPPDGPLPAEHVDLIRRWIEQGAPCDREAFVESGPLDGEAIYGRSCAGCHGAAGEGGSGPAMATAVSGLSAEAVAAVAQQGAGSMPAILTDAEEAALVADFVLSEWGAR